jgi:DNA-directed RNA polymerase beta' subunit
LKLAPISWNECYEQDIKTGLGFNISNPVAMVKDQKTIDGIYSPLFGGEMEDDTILERYRCQCKNYIGKFFEGEICPKCNTEVNYINDDIEKTGWISLEYDIISPLFFYKIGKYIGKKNLLNIIKYTKEIDIDGNVSEEETKKNCPFDNIGLMEFQERFDEIIEHYKNEEKQNLYEHIVDNRDKIFTSKIPVFSTVLRPILIIKNMFRFSDINRKFMPLISNIAILNKTKSVLDQNMLKVLPLLYNIQLLVNEIHEMAVDMVAGKEGHIRGSILGIRVNFSSRCVIIPLIGDFKINEVVLPYLCFLELWKYEILNLLCQMEKCTLNEAHRRWHHATQEFDTKIYYIMKMIIDKTVGGVKVLVNRPPTLNYGNILCMTVKDVKQDYDDLTASLPVNILRLLDGDFDKQHCRREIPLIAGNSLN